MNDIEAQFTYEECYELGIADAVADLIATAEFCRDVRPDLDDFLGELCGDIGAAKVEAREYCENS